MSPTTTAPLHTPAPLTTIETCNSAWEFDEERHLFRRTLRRGAAAGVVTPWRSYERLLVDASGKAFVVLVEGSRSRVLVGRRCDAGCRCRISTLERRATPAHAAAPLGRSRVCTLRPLAGAHAETRIIPLPLAADAAPTAAL